MKKILNFLQLIKEHLNGDFAYKNYLKSQKQNHSCKTLNKREFLLQKQQEKFNKPNRCC